MASDDLAWLAGILEGEACFHANSVGSPAIRVVMTDEDIVVRVAAMFQRNVKAQPPRCASCKPTFVVALGGWAAIDLMVKIRPWMGHRRKAKIDELIAAQQGVYRQGGTVCRRGHLWRSETTYVNPRTGWRVCKICRDAYPSVMRKKGAARGVR